MSKEQDKIKIKKELFTILDNMGIKTDGASENSHLRNDLGIDSLDMVEILMDCEKWFNIHISDDEAEKCSIVDDVVELIYTKKSN